MKIMKIHALPTAAADDDDGRWDMERRKHTGTCRRRSRGDSLLAVSLGGADSHQVCQVEEGAARGTSIWGVSPWASLVHLASCSAKRLTF